jgi:hypothetical protein
VRLEAGNGYTLLEIGLEPPKILEPAKSRSSFHLRR